VKSYELTIYSEERFFEQIEAGTYSRREVGIFPTEQEFIKWANKRVKKGECFSFTVAR
jgi:hypothetical protein